MRKCPGTTILYSPVPLPCVLRKSVEGVEGEFEEIEGC